MLSLLLGERHGVVQATRPASGPVVAVVDLDALADLLRRLLGTLTPQREPGGDEDWFRPGGLTGRSPMWRPLTLPGASQATPGRRRGYGPARGYTPLKSQPNRS